MRLNERQKRFSDYYIETGNATESALKAGYSKRTAATIGSENLHKPHILKYINGGIAKKDNERIAKQDEILSFLTAVMRNETTEQVPIPSEIGAKIVDKNTYVKDRVKAAELLGKRYMMWVERQHIDGEVGVQIVDDIGEVDDTS